MISNLVFRKVMEAAEMDKFLGIRGTYFGGLKIYMDVGIRVKGKIPLEVAQTIYDKYPNDKYRIKVDDSMIAKPKDCAVDNKFLKETEIIRDKYKDGSSSEIREAIKKKEKYKGLADKELDFKELNNYPLILQPRESNTRMFLDNYMREYNVTLNPNIELASYSLVVEFTKIGLGIGYVTKEYITNLLKEKKLYELKTKEKIPSRSIGIMTSKNHIPNFSTKKLIEIITK